MIKLTRLTGEEFVLNAELIRYVERRPDTYITLTTDDRVIVRETLDEVLQKALDYARRIRVIPFEEQSRFSRQRADAALPADAPRGNTLPGPTT